MLPEEMQGARKAKAALNSYSPSAPHSIPTKTLTFYVWSTIKMGLGFQKGNFLDRLYS